MALATQQLLDSLGLSGSYQVHIYPNLLTIDLRAHQIFYGFDSRSKNFESRLTKVYGSQPEYLSIDPIVVRGLDQFHAGGLYGLVEIANRLLGPGGCPWDQAQTHASLKKYLLEESYELFQAIDCNDKESMAEELGDVLLQPIMHSQMNELAGGWGIETVARRVSEKLIRRHPHVFGDIVASTPDEVLQNWDQIKRQEKSTKGEDPSLLGGIPNAMPALMLALEVSKRAARAGFEWPDINSVWEKVGEETVELKQAIANQSESEQINELGDLLFTIVNIARWLKIDPEDSLRTMVTRFKYRFEFMEKLSPGPLSDLTPQEWDDLWNQAKVESHHFGLKSDM